MDIFWRTISRKDHLDLKISGIFNKSNIDLTILEENNSWRTNITESNMRKYAERYKTQLSDYKNNIKKYLTQPLDNVEIVLINDTFQIKIILENQMKTLYFETVMMKVDFARTILSIADRLSCVKKQYFDDFTNIKIENEKLKEDKIQLEGKLNEFIERKKNDEDELLSKCMILLNEKKRQIQHLNDLLIAFKHGRPVTNPNIPPKKGKASKKSDKIVDTAPESESSSDESSSSKSDQSYITEDEEQDAIIQEKVSSEPPEDIGVETQQKRDLMTFDDDDDLPIIPLGKRLRQESVDLSSIVMTQGCQKKTIEKDNEPPSNDVNDELPVVQYNTQDLLDNI